MTATTIATTTAVFSLMHVATAAADAAIVVVTVAVAAAMSAAVAVSVTVAVAVCGCQLRCAHASFCYPRRINHAFRSRAAVSAERCSKSSCPVNSCFGFWRPPKN